MKKITKLALAVFLMSISNALIAQETCTADGTKVYYTTNLGWSDSEWYRIIDIDAANLNATNLATHDGTDGRNTSTTFSSGTLTTPVYKWNDIAKVYEATSKNWPVVFHMACQAPTFYTSARTKVDNGANVSGNGVNDASCFHNNNSVKTSPVWDKTGFIELSRQGNGAAPSQHGYVQINDLPQVERVQWSYSSTGWKRGVKLDIKYNDGSWEPLRWEPSDIAASLAGFSEQGYGFEEIIGKHEDPTSKISLRWRIWDGDSIHINPVNVAGNTYTTVNSPYASKQVVRIHQIKIYSGVDSPEAPSSVQTPQFGAIKVYLSDKNIVLSETANVEVYSYDGKRVFKGISDKIDVSAFTKGVYIVKALSASGKAQTKIVL